jgi:hypothetical protein
MHRVVLSKYAANANRLENERSKRPSAFPQNKTPYLKLTLVFWPTHHASSVWSHTRLKSRKVLK